MKNKQNKVVNFQIDDLPSTEHASQTLHDDYHQPDLQDFLKRAVDESTEEDFSYSNKSVQKAGRKLRKKAGDLKSATEIIRQFRAAHKVPLETISNFVKHCCRELGLDVRPVTRLKRLETIIDKLQRSSLDGNTENATCVTNMNDIGGCRAIFPDLKSLNQVKQHLEYMDEKLEDMVEKLGEGVRIKYINDYIASPKSNDCGYRSVHVIYRHKHVRGKSFNIEVQLRTRRQHLWATTVEIVDILEKTKIKTHSHLSNENKNDLQIKWEELLSLMSRYIADIEGAIELPQQEKDQLSIRLRELNAEIDALDKLKTFKILSEEVKAYPNDQNRYVLLLIDEDFLKLVHIKKFESDTQAVAAYNAAEMVTTQSDRKINTVLVSTEDMGQLSEAYPNYLGDCAEFIKLLQKAMKPVGSEPD